MFKFEKLTSEVIKEISKMFDEIELQGVPFYFKQSNVALKIGKHPYLENELNERIFLCYNKRVNDFVIQGYIVKINKETRIIEFEGGVEDYIVFFIKNAKKFDAEDLISLEIEIYKNGLDFDFCGEYFIKVMHMEEHLFGLGGCKSCGGLTIDKKTNCSFCEGEKKKPTSIYDRELSRINKLHKANGNKK